MSCLISQDSEMSLSRDEDFHTEISARRIFGLFKEGTFGLSLAGTSGRVCVSSPLDRALVTREERRMARRRRTGRQLAVKAVAMAALVALVARVPVVQAVAQSETSVGVERQGRRLESTAYTSSGGYKDFDSYAVDYTLVSAAPEPRTVQVNDIGACFCDLTANACDSNCCCDPDCDDQDKALFSGCLPESPENPKLTYCVPKSVVQTVNLKSSGSLAVVHKTTPKKDFFSELLCVEKDNNPAFGNFFMDPGAGSSDKLTEVLTRNPQAQYETSVLETQQAVTFESSYRANETIPVAHGATDTPKHAALSIPVAVFGGKCRDVELVGFASSVPLNAGQGPRKCLRRAKQLSTECFAGSPFLSPAHYVSDLKVSTTPARSAYVPVTITEASTFDSATGEIVAIAGALPGTTYNAASATCENVLKSLKYVVTHNGNGVITAVGAEVVVTNVAGTAGAALEQEFSVAFQKEGTSQPARGKSGNPGYRATYPVLFGIEETDAGTGKTAVSQFTEGLPMISSDARGECTAQYTRSLPYGSQSMSSCKVTLFREQLKRFCNKDTTAFAAPAIPAYCPVTTDKTDYFQTFFAETATPLPIKLLSGLFGSSGMAGTYAGAKFYAGVWGDSDPANTADWIEFEVESLDDGMSWNEQEGTCSKVVSGVQYEFLTANVGSQQNPQRKVTYARVKFTYDDWTFSDPALDACPQAFSVYSSSTFVEMDQQVDENVKPPAPPVFPKLPEDAFYPFLTN